MDREVFAFSLRSCSARLSLVETPVNYSLRLVDYTMTIGDFPYGELPSRAQPVELARVISSDFTFFLFLFYFCNSRSTGTGMQLPV